MKQPKKKKMTEDRLNLLISGDTVDGDGSCKNNVIKELIFILT